MAHPLPPKPVYNESRTGPGWVRTRDLSVLLTVVPPLPKILINFFRESVGGELDWKTRWSWNLKPPQLSDAVTINRSSFSLSCQLLEAANMVHYSSASSKVGSVTDDTSSNPDLCLVWQTMKDVKITAMRLGLTHPTPQLAAPMHCEVIKLFALPGCRAHTV